MRDRSNNRRVTRSGNVISGASLNRNRSRRRATRAAGPARAGTSNS